MATPGRRLRHIARLISGERKVSVAARRALTELLDEAARALAGAGYSTDVLDNRFPGWRRALANDLEPTIAAVYVDAFEAAGRGVVIDPEVYATRHLAEVQNRLVNVSDDVFDSMRLTLEAGRRAGEGIPLLAARIEGLLGDSERWASRAATIARTEVVSANNAGATQSAAATASVLGEDPASVMKEWLSTTDSRTRETHLELDGQSVMGLDSLFDNGLAFPGDPSGDAAEVVNCRCTLLFIYPGDPEYQGVVDGGAFGGRTTASEALGDGGANTIPASVAPAPALAPAAVAQVPVDSGPQSQADYSAREATIQELQDQASSGRGKAKTAAKAELRRRGLAASAGHTDDELTAEVVARMTRHLTVEEVLAGTVNAEDLVIVAHDCSTRTLDQFVNQEDPVTTTPPEAEAPAPTEALPEPTHAGLAVWATDTQRVLMLQRSLDPTDPPEVQGTWEFPGGGIEEGETPQQAAEREFTEETGLAVPAGEVTGGWRSTNGVYQGFVLTVSTELDAFGELNPDLAAAEAINPDDPQRRNPDVTAWFTLEQAQGLGPALRPEVHDTPWDVFTDPAEEAPVTEPDPALAAALTLVRSAGYALTAAEGDVPAVVSVPAENPEGPALAQDIAPDGEPFYGIAAPEEVLSGDGRLFADGALTWRDLPLPLMVQDAQAPGHDGAVRAGRLDVLERDTSGPKPMIRYAGVWDTSPAALEARRQVEAGVSRGVSVDCDAVTVEVSYLGSDGRELDPEVDEFPADGIVTERERATAARISGLTICSIPAFHQAYIANGTLADRTDPEPGMAEVNGEVVPTAEPLPEDVVAVAAAAAGEKPAPAWALVASGGPIIVPAAAFSRPDELDAHASGTPLTVTADGRVYGHLATWGTCHIGISGLCQEPPASSTNYAYFATGSVLTDEGTLQPVGKLTMETGHAGLRLGHQAAVSHYDNTGTVVADVAMGQDHIGIWFAGVVRPGATETQVYALRAAGKVSGDWRPVAGGLELVAALVVNTEGFPVPRPAIAASAGTVHALVAAGIVQTDREPETHDSVTAAARAAVAYVLDRRDRTERATARLSSQRTTVRRRRVAAAAARIERV